MKLTNRLRILWPVAGGRGFPIAECNRRVSSVAFPYLAALSNERPFAKGRNDHPLSPSAAVITIRGTLAPVGVVMG